MQIKSQTASTTASPDGMGRRPGGAAAHPVVPTRTEISSHHLIDEPRLVGMLIERASLSDEEARRTAELARRLVVATRSANARHGGVDAFMSEYGLSSEEGVILLCLAEALLRIPDKETADKLIAEKIGEGEWSRHLGASSSTFVNASTFGLMLTGRVVKFGQSDGSAPLDTLKRMVARSGEAVIRQALRQAVKLLGDQFVLGRDIETAIKRAASWEAKGHRLSYDMLGEAALSDADARRYFERYMHAVETVGRAAGPFSGSLHADALVARPNISVKLSAIHPRFEPGKEPRLARELQPRLLTLVRAARDRGVTVTIDAEEQDRLDIELDAFAATLADPSLAGWQGLGIAVQAYSRRAMPVLRWLRQMSEATAKRVPVRLVKGAYWDSEIKRAQVAGLADYPVLTRKAHTDLSFLAAARYLLTYRDAFYPALATHNAQSLAAVHVVGGSAAFEYQRLHGMGEALYSAALGEAQIDRPLRIYAPVGEHEDLLAYLVRRLLENGANSSFVHRLSDSATPVEAMIADPVVKLSSTWHAGGKAAIATDLTLAKPCDILLPERQAAEGVALAEPMQRAALLLQLKSALEMPFFAAPIVDGKAETAGSAGRIALSPHDLRERLGTVHDADAAIVERAIASATAAAHRWAMTPAERRADVLEAAARMFVRDRARLMAVIIRETGRTLLNAEAEVREAVDFLRYYASAARARLASPRRLKGPTGEVNTLALRGRGPVAAIAPWNFPLAILTGQIAAALAAGNPVLAKPAEQSPLTAHVAVQILHEAGVPADCLHLLTGAGATGAMLVADARVKAILFTGSIQTAWAIQSALARRRGALIPFIAETGGINAMIADSSALPEQVARDCIRSAFDSAGQRCSAARVLYVQKDIAARVIDLLVGATQALDIGDPLDPANDIGPVIDARAQDDIDAHKLTMSRRHKTLADIAMPDAGRPGSFVTPAIYEVERMADIGGEVFGPVLHVVRYAGDRLAAVVDEINASGYGLTLGLHSRIEAVADFVAEHARVGNLYVNRNQIGAVPGVQPFGGDGLSGTGPKAGGPQMLAALSTERVRTTDVTATGGNFELLSRD
ncbi:MAG: bifunctional proline dehydrogenase/L-glutamate gamma-semialdehyde dehydrogenase PutA [Hyphomicrobiaceae bacterium]